MTNNKSYAKSGEELIKVAEHDLGRTILFESWRTGAKRVVTVDVDGKVTNIIELAAPRKVQPDVRETLRNHLNPEPYHFVEGNQAGKHFDRKCVGFVPASEALVSRDDVVKIDEVVYGLLSTLSC